MTAGAYCLGYLALHACVGRRSAISPEAEVLSQAVSAVVVSSERSQALFGKKAEALSRMSVLAIECEADDWDGNGGAAIDPIALQNAEAFVRALPDHLPMPEFAADPDGAVSLDWIAARNRVFSVSIGASNRLAYAWLDGTDKGHCVASFDGTTVPRRLMDTLSPILPHGIASFRTA